MSDAMVLELAPDGRVKTVRPHLRPWLALDAFRARPRAQGRRSDPGVVFRALRG